jgi:hypothetical protein
VDFMEGVDREITHNASTTHNSGLRLAFIEASHVEYQHLDCVVHLPLVKQDLGSWLSLSNLIGMEISRGMDFHRGSICDGELSPIRRRGAEIPQFLEQGLLSSRPGSACLYERKPLSGDTDF